MISSCMASYMILVWMLRIGDPGLNDNRRLVPNIDPPWCWWNSKYAHYLSNALFKTPITNYPKHFLTQKSPHLFFWGVGRRYIDGERQSRLSFSGNDMPVLREWNVRDIPVLGMKKGDSKLILSIKETVVIQYRENEAIFNIEKTVIDYYGGTKTSTVTNIGLNLQ